MNASGRLRLVDVAVVAVVLLAFFPTTTISAGAEYNFVECSGKFKKKRLTEEQLREVLKLHERWWLFFSGKKKDKNKNSYERANLCGAILSEANLDAAILGGANLSRANLSRAKLGFANLRQAFLHGANLSGADLSNTKLNRANLSKANLTGAFLQVANLSGADLGLANLSGANLYKANLSGASLSGANLSKANLSTANLSGASLIGANLAGTTIGLLSAEEQLPEFTYWQSAKNLAQLKIVATALSLSAFQRLRGDFKKNGMRSEERGVTAALQRTQVAKANRLERIFRYVAFDVTSEYGNSPGRPLLILVSGIFLFMPFYAVALMIKNLNGRGAIWRVWSEERLLDISSDEKDKKKRERLSGLAIHKALLYGLYFSLLSAFHFGWRELNVGNWISRIQPREYALRATGWVRAVSGVQSLLSVYLVALWALTYFGRPFE